MNITAKIRMYNQQDLGDCFLLQFSKGKTTSRIMIDFGSYEGGNIPREKEIAKDIVKAAKGGEVRIVVTHQHKDHISGFINAKEELSKLKVPELWLSFLDDKDSDAGEADRSVSTKYWQKNKKIKSLTKSLLGAHGPVQDKLKAKQGYDIFAEEQQGGKAYENLIALAKKNINYLTPGDNFGLPGLEEDVRVYVLGPPTDFNMLKSMNPKKGEAVEGLMALNELDVTSDFLLTSLENIDSGMIDQSNFPFDSFYYKKIDKSSPEKNSLAPKDLYKMDKDRQIEYEWLSDMGRLALHMDSLTNNSSLVLAFELVKSGKVLLFVGDAQIGNWKSWFDVEFKDSKVTAKDLLERTVLYKAGHHSSHNATYKEGLDMMISKELVIMIPLDQKISDKHKFLMGKPPMLTGYNRVSKGRVVRTDTIFQSDKGLPNLKYKFAQKIPGMSVSPNVKSNQLYIEYKIDG